MFCFWERWMKMMKFHAIFVTVLLLFFGLFELGKCKMMKSGQRNSNRCSWNSTICSLRRWTIQHRTGINQFCLWQVFRIHCSRFNYSRVYKFIYIFISFIQHGVLEFVKVLKAKEQVAAARIYCLTLEVVDAGKRKIYIWSQSMGAAMDECEHDGGARIQTCSWLLSRWSTVRQYIIEL